MNASANITANRKFVELHLDDEATTAVVLLTPEEAARLAAEIKNAYILITAAR